MDDMEAVARRVLAQSETEHEKNTPSSTSHFQFLYCWRKPSRHKYQHVEDAFHGGKCMEFPRH